MLRWMLLLLLAIMLLLCWRLVRGRSRRAVEVRGRPGLSPVQELQGAPPSFGAPRREGESGSDAGGEARASDRAADDALSRSTGWEQR